MTGKHTHGELQAVANALFKKERTSDLYPIAICGALGAPYTEADANSARLALCWNMHDRLTQTLKAIQPFIATAHKASRNKAVYLPLEESLNIIGLTLAEIDGAK